MLYLQVEGALKALEEAVRQYNLAAHSLALIPVSAKRADGAEYEINLDRNAAAPTALVNIDLKVGCQAKQSGYAVSCGEGIASVIAPYRMQRWSIWI